MFATFFFTFCFWMFVPTANRKNILKSLIMTSNFEFKKKFKNALKGLKLEKTALIQSNELLS